MCPKRPSEVLDVGLIGCGNVARTRHLPVIRRLEPLRLAAVADPDSDARVRAVSGDDTVLHFDDGERLIAEADVRIVVVCTPLPSHARLAISALETGRHVLCEKPIALTAMEAERIADAASVSAGQLLVGFNRRWLSTVRMAKRMLDRGVVGTIKAVSAVYTSGHDMSRVPPWRRVRALGGGAILEDCAHVFDLWRFLTDDEISRVCAQVGPAAEADDEPVAVSGRGRRGTMFSCLVSDYLPYRQEMTVIGEKGSIRIEPTRFDGVALTPAHVYPGTLRTRLQAMSRPWRHLLTAWRDNRLGGTYQASYHHMWRHFVESLATGAKPGCTAADGVESLRVALAAIESADSGRAIEVGQITETVG